MKRILSFILVFALLLGVGAVNTYAADYSSEEVKMIKEEFNTLKKSIDALFCKDNTILYWNYANEQEEKKFFNNLVIQSSYLLDTPPNEDFYIEQLTTLIALYEADAIKGVEKQSEFDNVKSGGDIALDIIDIATGALGGKINNKTVKAAVSAVKNSQSFAIDTYEEVKCYEAAIKAYNNSTLFLEAIINNTSNKKLKSAANTLKNANSDMFKYKVKATTNIANNVSKYSASFIMDDIYGEAIKQAKKSSDKALVKFANGTATAISTLAANLNIGTTIFAVSMVAGDILFGTSNSFSRHNEMRILADIAEALVKQNNKIKIPSGNDEEAIAAIKTKIEYYKLLLTTHSRGEYALYSLVHNEAGVLSAITSFLDKKEHGKDSKDWYKGQIACIEDYYEQLNGVFSVGKQLNFELHNGFILPVNQKDEVPEGFIGIYTFDDFNQIALAGPERVTTMNSGLNEQTSAKYILMNDIVCPADYKTALVFGGTLEGNGYTIHNVSEPLFDCLIGAEIKNLGIDVNYSKYEEEYDVAYGALANVAYPIFDGNYMNVAFTTVSNCFVNGKIKITTTESSVTVGAIIRNIEARQTKIESCYNSADIVVDAYASADVGGIICRTGSMGSVEISNCFNEGDITVTSTNDYISVLNNNTISAGGIACWGVDVIAKECLNAGNINISANGTNGAFAGGIWGGGTSVSGRGNAEFCYNSGNISAKRGYSADDTDAIEYERANSGTLRDTGFHSGGICGGSREGEIKKCWNEGEIYSDEMAGGLIGITFEAEITDCYNNGKVSAEYYAGGLVGFSEYGGKITTSYNSGEVDGAKKGALVGVIQDGEKLFENCYYTINMAPTAILGDFGKTKRVTKKDDKDVFIGFDFKSNWTFFGSQNGYPRLK